ncbi:MAG: PDZ domain-containing protein, partial [Anaerolineae bacterium]|nr:PDZ domain-containing protein [Anaerolineae bacterium]
ILLVGLAGCSLPVNYTQTAQPVKAQSVLVSQIEPVKGAPKNDSTVTEADFISELESTLISIYDNVNPSVVSLRVTKRTMTSSQTPGFPFSVPQSPEGGLQSGAGSGFVWDKLGHIITNNHVVVGGEKITVQFSDGSTAEAEIVGTDPDSDLAVVLVDVDPNRLYPVTVNDSNHLKVGQLAVAIGNPFGLDSTMTVGFISALGRSLPVDEGIGSNYTIPNIIQTDAPINPGNSGGVLVNRSGEVIGVTTAIVSPNAASAGIGFAVPAEIVTQVVPELIVNGTYKHAWIGISGLTLNSEIASAIDVPENTRGVMVTTVIEGSPAENAGLMAADREISGESGNLPVGGDVITALDGVGIVDFEDLVAMLSVRRAGDEIQLTILRNGEERLINLTLGERPTTTPAEPVLGDQESHRPVMLGITGMALNQELALALGFDADQKGVLVGQVMDDSVAANAGLLGSGDIITEGDQQYPSGGDLITAWNGEPVEDVSDIRRYVAETSAGDTVKLSILRDGEPLTLTLEF